VRGNLEALMGILGGRGPRPRAATTRAAWQTFFLMVPVISSTFASIDRLFAGFGRESLGWLLIDEAGQAAPQQAAGAIWRARRTVAVGDPLQIEPVVTMPRGGQQALSRLYGVAAEWAPSRTSVQRLADQAAPYGTWLRTATPDGSGRVWVGTPLRVHRRCDRPIFDVCNHIAYDGLMVYGTSARAPFHGRDVWYDVRGPDARGHWIPAEGDALRDTLTRLKAAGVPAAAIRVISPFRQVVRGALAVHGEVFPDGSIPSGQRERWVGTVHKMQGREADVVVLVLGGQPDRPRARSWAAERPNPAERGRVPGPAAAVRDRQPRAVEPAALLRGSGRQSPGLAARPRLPVTCSVAGGAAPAPTPAVAGRSCSAGAGGPVSLWW
jgi:hypothetical protein